MGIYPKLIGHDKLFSERIHEAIILNDLPSTTEEERRIADNLTTTIYENTDVFSNEPSCDCGKLRGGYRLNLVCSNCKTPVVETFSQDLHSLVWIRSPIGVRALINPMVLGMLELNFKPGGFSYIQWLCNTAYNNPKKHVELELQRLLDAGIVRGYNNFVENFDKYLSILVEHVTRKKGPESQKKRRVNPDIVRVVDEKKKKLNDLIELITRERDCVFSQHIPLPNKALMVIEKTNSGTYVDTVLAGAVDVIKSMRSIDTIMSPLSPRQKENLTARCMFKLVEFYEQFYMKVLGGKPGLFRRHIYGTRNCYSMRTVISSNTKAHAYDELHIPWAAAISMFELHLANKLFLLDHSVNEIYERLQAATYTYDPILDQIFQELIAETRDGHFWCYWNRNPSLKRASCERMRITRIKTDPNDPTITTSILAVKGFNADFDGDAMNLVLAVDNYMADAMEYLSPHMNMFSDDEPRTLSDMASLPRPVVTTIMNWYSSERDQPATLEQRYFLQSLAS